MNKRFDQEHLRLIKSGWEIWNAWRKENKHIVPHLPEVDLSEADLKKVNLSNANLSYANLSHANLSDAIINNVTFNNADLSNTILDNVNLSNANLSNANLSKASLKNAFLYDANLYNANLYRANFYKANLEKANLNKANLSHANFSYAYMDNVNLYDANLYNADFSNVNLNNSNLDNANLDRTNLNHASIYNTHFTGSKFKDADFSNCNLASTVFGLTELEGCKGLENVIVHGPCVIDFPTLRASKNLPKEFLTKMGIPELLMDYLPDFYNPALMIYPAFLSHSGADKEFVLKLYNALTKNGVTIWLDEKKLKPGDNVHDNIADAIKHYDKLILVCSKNSLQSWWVERELERAFEKERQMQKQRGKKFRLVIPLRLDDSVFNSEGSIFDTLRNSVIGDFRSWKDENIFDKSLKELLDALNANRPDIKPQSFL